MKSLKFDQIASYFDELDRKTSYVYHKGVRTAGGGYFIPTPIREFGSCLQILHERRIIHPGQVYHDVGYADGRVVDSADAYEMVATGSEIDPLWANHGRQNTENLQRMGAVNGVKLATGDFANEETFRDGLGLAFTDVEVFFHFHNITERVASRIADKSPRGTLFLSACHSEHPQTFSGLEHLTKLPLQTSSRWARFLHAYAKRSQTIYPVQVTL